MNPPFTTTPRRRPPALPRRVLRPFGSLPLGAIVCFIAAVLLGSGCDFLNVDNPNSVVEGELQNPSSATALANGAEALVTEALGVVLGPYSTASDEITWIGTRDAWQQLDQGGLGDPTNEFSDAAHTALAEARWTADEAIRRLEAFRQNGTLGGPTPLIRSYAYGAIAYITAADAFDNFVVGSDKRAAAPPVGADNMGTLYDTAIAYLTRGLEQARQADARAWQTRLLALRARAHHARALWPKLNPPTPGDPLAVSDQAVADAQAALDRAAPDWRFQLETTSETAAHDLASNVNNQLQLHIGDAYIDAQGAGEPDRVAIADPIDGVPAPALTRTIQAFTSAEQYADITVASARELHLIIAEAALATGDPAAFREHINAIRSLDGLAPYQGETEALELLKHHRRTNLFLQGRRLADLYRFGERSPEWTSLADPGTFLPITVSEIRANPHVDFD